ncbi:HAD-IIB family hydrolase [Halieaceae bacterium IMCC14734]|uniref:HAD-IIB family hydrolase n=1 Tax=Candidatus Litorirhabdus singularis TaxID=2518993 RepID=A0ABT3TEE4_9GAMM|nr:HAD-IIB family hydrolase [Candidatus Litorirhabdus singularis]MCX2980195.1 HAD-IIB family hydrolase [Candidatus Litorirhabdus singularis]
MTKKRSLLGHYPLVVTDLDGTLLDRESYSFAAALPALEELQRRGIPLILNSSKTATEMLELQRALGIQTPFIAENGAGLYRVTATGDSQLWHSFAAQREVVLGHLCELRDEHQYRFRGFADMSPVEISACTGLTPAQAVAAAARAFSEPLQWQDTAERLHLFMQQITDAGLYAVQGGRFLTVTGPCNKGAALKALLQELGVLDSAYVVALGDSPNDIELLQSADVAVVIRSVHSEPLQVEGPARVIRSQAEGPSGWQEVMQTLLAEPALQTERL